MSQGRMVSTVAVSCAVCSAPGSFVGPKANASAQAEELGWGNTKELGWVCRNCLGKSAPLRHLLPHGFRIVKDQPITEQGD